ncbi:hypothetical protein TOT_020000545 [Theileria orientalis strain Shintoku]|uniref:Uncharacterized protein n=1 Tax=Theileria orientalis strain Shintoku TaxID=869250 RepID=J4D7N9_THEOR|nr:hypothetical protein TOT_020000545 [Theileria orientalis strain Shintoku]BAM40285.1 hypothetical protein TOT_020000545 [Theileria orientalis strain Shintoku]|eukprot:XP_009690586.1 hypothetical protein TOT_020000545 [Theileria orientalis strain Shintoku]
MLFKFSLPHIQH